MGKKDKKSKTAEQKARVAAKQSKKATQKSRKSQAKEAVDSDAEDVDLDSILAEYVKKQALYLKVTEEPSGPPSPRSSATLLASPAKSNELLLFGGEFYNGALANFYNDLFIYTIDKDEWRMITSPNSPLPRSGHSWCRGGNTGGIYLFGGEFSSPKQGTFHHYNDFWHLDPLSREWTRLEGKGKSPPARSGHRMTFYKNYILLFGGFQDTSQQTRYLQDLWVYDCTNFIWHSPILPPTSQRPEPRSSFSFLPHENGAVLYGGYSRAKVNIVPGKQNKSSGHVGKSILRPIVHTDTWLLKITAPSPESSRSDPPQVRWERRKKPANPPNPPNPPRAGATMAYHRGRGILFGGVHDTEESEEGIESEFFDSLFAWNIDRNRFFPLNLRKPRTLAKKQVAEVVSNRRARGKADEKDLLRNLAALEAHGTLADAGEPEGDANIEAIEDPTPVLEPKPIHFTFPRPRFNAQLTVQEDVLYMFGGTFENQDREYTFNEMHATHLGRLDGVKELYREEVENWHESDEGESESEEDELGEAYSEDEEDEEDGGVSLSTPARSQVPSEVAPSMTEVETEATEMELDQSSDRRPQPRPFESLRDFYTRTSNDWQELLIRQDKDGKGRSVKELRTIAFEHAQSKWWDAREEITAMEMEQEEAGIGEIVNIADRGQEAGAGGRRR